MGLSECFKQKARGMNYKKDNNSLKNLMPYDVESEYIHDDNMGSNKIQPPTSEKRMRQLFQLGISASKMFSLV